MNSMLRGLRTIAVYCGAFAMTPLADAAINNWTGASGSDLFWGTAGNWSPGGPPGPVDTAIFNDVAAATDAVTINNRVSASRTIQSLVYGQTNGWHNTLIGPGVTLTVAGNNTGIILQVGTETDNGSTQRETNSVGGQGGTLVLNNTNASFVVRQGSGAANGAKAIFDLSGLDSFIATVGQIFVGVGNPPGLPNINRNTATLYLAKTNVIRAVSGTGPAIDVGKSASNNGGGSLVYLGQTNAIFTDSLGVGREKETGVSVLFNPAFVDPSVTFRGADGVNRVNIWAIGDGVANSGTTTCRGTCDFSGGAVDALVNTLTIGRAATAGTGANVSTGTLTFDRGTIDVNTLQVGLQTTANVKSGNGTINVNGTANLVVNTALQLAQTAGSTGATTTSGTLSINGGTVRANTITNSSGGVSVITSIGGTLILTNLLGVAGTPSAPLTTLTLSDSKVQLAAGGAGGSLNVTALSTSSTTNNTIHIAFIPAIATYPAQFRLIQYSSFVSSFDFVLGTLPVGIPSYQGYISNNLASSSIDLVLTAGPAPAGLLKWTGAINTNWDLGLTTNWLNSGKPSTFHDGDSVLFDDSSAITSVNFTTMLSPGGITVSNSSIYTFTGPGKLGGAGGLTKSGAEALNVANSGINDFVGAITISGGSVQVGDGGTNGSIGSGAITDNATLIFNRSDAFTLPNLISGSGTLTMSGTGILTLTASNSFTGLAQVNAGTLLVNGINSSSLTSATGTILGGNGTNAGSISAGGGIQPGPVNAIGTFTAGSDLILHAGATLRFDLSATDSTPGLGSNDLIEVSGNLALNNNAITLNFLGIPQAGFTYRLMDFAGAKSGNFDTTIRGTHFVVLLDQATPNQIIATVIGGSGANLKWNSVSRAAWDSGITANWINLNTGQPDYFGSGDSVLFDDSAAGVQTNVTIDAGISLSPGSVTINSSVNNYSIGGAGRMSGAASLLKGGTSTLSLNTANNFTGEVAIQGGTLKTGSATALGTTAGGTTISPGATLDVNGQNLGAEPITVSGDGVGGLGAIVNSGLQQINALRSVTLAGNTTFGGGSALTNAGAGRWDIRGTSSLNTGGNPYKITKVGTNQVSLVGVGTIDPVLGDIDIKEGVFAVQTTTTQVGDPNKTITVFSNATLNVYQLTATPLNKLIVLRNGSTIFSENGFPTIAGPITLQGSGTINVNNAGTTPSLTLNNSITGPGGLIKIGPASLNLMAASSYAGTTVISNGTVNVSGSIGGGGVVVYGGSLVGVGTITAPVTIQPGGSLAPAGATLGSLTIASTLQLAGTTIMDVNKSGTFFTRDSLPGVTTLTYGGTLQLNLAGDPLALGDVIPLFSFSGANGAFSSIVPATPGTGLAWDTSHLKADGTLRVAPPPLHVDTVMLAGQNIVFAGSGGSAGGTYFVLSSTNAALPFSIWPTIATGNFLADGRFSFTTAVDANALGRFFLIQKP